MDKHDYKTSPSLLAAWLDQADSWWSVDGDPLLTSLVSFPCPARDLAAELRKINKPLLILTPLQPSLEQGATEEQLTSPSDLAPLFEVERHQEGGQSYENRKLRLRWEADPMEWLLVEDQQIARWASDASSTDSARQ